MRIAVQADDGDQVSICADFVSAEQAIVTLEIENPLYKQDGEFESLTLTIEKARELASALLSVADAVEFVRQPASVSDWTVDDRVPLKSLTNAAASEG
jgi:hypothetical protein